MWKVFVQVPNQRYACVCVGVCLCVCACVCVCVFSSLVVGNFFNSGAFNIDEHLDETGEIAVTSVSKLTIPQNLPPQKSYEHHVLHSRIIFESTQNKTIHLGKSNSYREALLFTTSAVMTVQIPSDSDYDGNADGILNLDNHRLFTWELLDSYWDKFKLGSVSYTGM